MKQEFYVKKQKENTIELLQLKRKSTIMSVFRLIFFLMAAVGFSIFAYEKIQFCIYIAVLGLILFLYSLMWQNKLDAQIELKLSINEVIESYFKRFNHSWQNLEKKGEQFKPNSSFLASDLDIIGNNSLFQYLCLAQSSEGQTKLYDSLVNSSDDFTKTLKKQEAISELANKQELHLKLSSLFYLFDEYKSKLILNNETYISQKQKLIYQILSIVLPSLILISLTLAFIGYLPIGYAAIMIIINIMVFVLNNKRNNNYTKEVLNNHSNLNIIIQALQEIEKTSFESEYLQEIHAFLSKDYQASYALNKLVKFQAKIQSQSNALIYFIKNILFLTDFKNVLSFDHWKKHWGKNANEYIDLFSDLEVLISLGVIEQTHSNTTKPILLTSKPSLNFNGIYHPLLNKEKVISNDFKTKASTNIITGSNMSGKTTFIRSIGTNLVLAYAGAFVCASEFEASYLHIATSIRVEDDFNQGISTFYAEINRIKGMIEYTKTNQPLICFVDEIFKGTNSEDRIYGASKAIEHLTNENTIAFVTTHDAQLCQLDGVINHHFAEYYEDNEIRFDYLIKNGECKTRNAKYLLKMAGIIE